MNNYENRTSFRRVWTKLNDDHAMVYDFRDYLGEISVFTYVFGTDRLWHHHVTMEMFDAAADIDEAVEAGAGYELLTFEQIDTVKEMADLTADRYAALAVATTQNNP